MTATKIETNTAPLSLPPSIVLGRDPFSHPIVLGRKQNRWREAIEKEGGKWTTERTDSRMNSLPDRIQFARSFHCLLSTPSSFVQQVVDPWQHAKFVLLVVNSTIGTRDICPHSTRLDLRGPFSLTAADNWLEEKRKVEVSVCLSPNVCVRKMYFSSLLWRTRGMVFGLAARSEKYLFKVAEVLRNETNRCLISTAAQSRYESMKKSRPFCVI